MSQPRRSMSASIDKGVFCERIFEILSQKLDVQREKLFFISKFCGDLGAEELDQADIIIAFENEFGIRIRMTPRARSRPSAIARFRLDGWPVSTESRSMSAQSRKK